MLSDMGMEHLFASNSLLILWTFKATALGSFLPIQSPFFRSAK